MPFGSIFPATMVNTQRLVEALGLKPVGRDPRRDEDVLIERVRTGLPFSALEAIASRFDLGSQDLLRILRLPERTLARRRKARVLSAEESDRLVRLGRIAALAEETLGNVVKASGWLRRPNPVLGDTAPILWLDTDVGAREVEEVLIRIAHGVQS
jgi:putative toxin-antitoxin system antitoxin component (TIGR02293 family)